MPSLPTSMRAVVHHTYGPPRTSLDLTEVPVPSPAPHEVLIKVAAGSLNALDWHLTTGEPMFARLVIGLKPQGRIPGADVSGTIVATGADVTDFGVGDEVLAVCDAGAFAEYVAVPAERLVRRPSTLSLAHSAAIGVAAYTAVQGLRDWGQLQPGQSVLINGASGGVGTFAVQIAKALGAGHVTAVSSTRNLEQSLALGADEVIDYTRTPLGELDREFDLFFDNAGSTTLRKARSLVRRGGRYVMITAPMSRWIKPLPRMLGSGFAFIGSGRTAVAGKTAAPVTADVALVAQWAEAGIVTPTIEQELPLTEAIGAIDRQGAKHARGKTLILP